MTADSPHILVVDDDRRLRELLRKYLSDNGFRVTTAANAADARRQLGGLEFDLLVLDIMMPGEDGFALTDFLRRKTDVPILLLTAMGEPEDRIAGLERGADDYLSKPFEPRELLLRLRTILRRAPPPRLQPSEIRLGEARFDIEREELLQDDRVLHLTSSESRLLRVLAENAGVPLSREQLARRTQIDGNIRTVDVQVTRLRRKIEPNPKQPRYLKTVRGKGYVLRPD